MESYRIAITCYPTSGGSGVVATELGMELARMGHEVHFVTYSLPFRLKDFQKNIFFHQVDTRFYYVFQDAPYSLSLAAKMCEVAERHRVDVLHVHYAIPHAVSAFLARSMFEPNRLLTITTLHGTDITLVGQEPSFHRITKFSIESSDRVTAVSEFLRARTEESFQTKKDIEVIPNFVDVSKFTPDGATVAKTLFCPSGQPLIIHASNFRPVKNISGVLRVFSRVRAERACRLVMIGDGPERLPAEKLCAQLGIEGDVLFLGNQECIERVLPIADVLLLPSEHESFGLVCLEAMSCGVPVVATNVGGVKEVVQHGKIGFLHDPYDVEGMVGSLLGLLEDDDKRHTFGQEARRVAVEQFEVSSVVKKYVDLYERAHSGTSQGTSC
ncbi:MAG: N-acetyl-alpha-D-glucosaminyl L-malate synthase BshA [Candidatus Eiseniibacteriota bacterium]|nr:MAG: N-acetyl-alpha-D-glucosaminyl L-malate synthase BshA [Candidatus Eisenbacteria bacterium]